MVQEFLPLLRCLEVGRRQKAKPLQDVKNLGEAPRPACHLPTLHAGTAPSNIARLFLPGFQVALHSSVEHSHPGPQKARGLLLGPANHRPSHRIAAEVNAEDVVRRG